MALGGLTLIAGLALSSMTLQRSATDAERLVDTDPVGGRFTDDAGPTPRVGATEPLGAPPAPPEGTGGYRFITTQADGERPVAYDPCRPVHYVVNDEDAPPGGAEALAAAVEEVAAATGLRFEDEGPTDERPGEDREPFQLDRYGDRWAPVVIWWARPERSPTLRGDVAGFAGSTSVVAPTGLVGPEAEVYVTGTVVLDGPELAELLDAGPDGTAAARAIIVHELGHLVGLDHVDDPDQLMHPETSGELTELGDGDRRGLAALGRGTCFREL